jgi:hypothetical protein
LKIARLTFSVKKKPIISYGKPTEYTLSNPADSTASNKLDVGPAIATSAAPNSPYLTAYGLKGTGFAAIIGG